MTMTMLLFRSSRLARSSSSSAATAATTTATKITARLPSSLLLSRSYFAASAAVPPGHAWPRTTRVPDGVASLAIFSPCQEKPGAMSWMQPVTWTRTRTLHVASYDRRCHQDGLATAQQRPRACFFSTLAENDNDNDNNKVDEQQQPINIRMPHMKRICILYASQGGTAQIFAMQVEEALQEAYPDLEISHQAVDEAIQSKSAAAPEDFFFSSGSRPDETLFLFLASTTGVGEPPTNSRVFYEWLLQKSAAAAAASNQNEKKSLLHFAVFGLGNAKAHPHHYNVIGKGIHEHLSAVGGIPVLPLTLGDDGNETLEDDFDAWMKTLVDIVPQLRSNDDSSSNDNAPTTKQQQQQETNAPPVAAATSTNSVKAPPQQDNDDEDVDLKFWDSSCVAALRSNGKRLASSNPQKYPKLNLRLPAGEEQWTVPLGRTDLLDLVSSSSSTTSSSNAFSEQLQGAHRLAVSNNITLNVSAAAAVQNGMMQMTIQLPADGSVTYTTGDHCIVYPRNPEHMVEAVCQYILDVKPTAIIEGVLDNNNNNSKNSKSTPYPFPTGISVMDTISHCIDLNALPSPTLARFVTGRSELNYKNDIVTPRRTVLDLLLEQPDESRRKQMSLEDFLYQMPRMQGRYYSIASSSVRHPTEILLTFRPVRYLTSRGVLREGTCTSFMSRIPSPLTTTTTSTSSSNSTRRSTPTVIAKVSPNPTFRLPSNPLTPVVLMAGGCGVAPIRAFLEERLTLLQTGAVDKFGPGMLFLGFRSPNDQVYPEIVQEALQAGALTHVYMTYNFGCATATTAASTTTATAGNDFVFAQQCGVVSDAVRKQGPALLEHWVKNGGYTYLCGGARTFGVAIENQVHAILQDVGHMTSEEATAYMQKMIAQGRFLEDLAD